MSDHVTIFEMAPRDGLQNEKRMIATADKIALVDRLSECGFSKIEVTSFVPPKWVPQMADASEVMAGIKRAPDVSYAVLTPNMRGFDAAVAAQADEIAIFAAASEGFSKAKAVARVANALFAMGCYEVSLGDTIGHATPEKTDAMLSAVLEVATPETLAGHFHDTKGRALDNIGVSLDRGLRVFDSCVGGLGGCPYAPGAKGNVATEAVIPFIAARGFETGLDSTRVQEAAAFAKKLVGFTNAGG